MNRMITAFVGILLLLAGCADEHGGVTPELSQLNNRGVATMGQFRYNDAAEIFAQAVERFPDNLDVRVNLAIAVINRQDKGDDDRALSILNDVIERDSDHLRALYMLGILYFNAGDIRRATPFFERVTQEDSDDAYAFYFLGQCYLQLDRPQNAFDAHVRASELDRRLRSAFYGAFASARRIGKRNAARQNLARYRRQANDPQSRLAEIKYTRMGEKATAKLLGSGSGSGSKQQERPDGELFGTPIRVSTISADRAWAVWLGEGRYGVIALTSGRTRWLEGKPDALREVNDHPLAGVLQVRAVGFGDVNNDGLVDAYMARTGTNRFWQQTAGGAWVEMGEELEVAGENLDSLDVKLFDADHDGDLDIFVANTGGPNELYNNNRDGTFAPLAIDNGLTGMVPNSRSVIVEDLDNDRDLDIAVINARTPNEVFLNDRTWEYHEGGPPWSNWTQTRLRAAIAIDVLGHGAVRFFGIDNDGTVARWALRQRRWEPRPIDTPLDGEADRLVFQDFNGNGRAEFLVASDNEWVIGAVSDLDRAIKVQKSRFLTLINPAAGRGPGVLVSDEDGIHYLPPGPGRLPFIDLLFSGKDEAGEGMRSNGSGIGSRALVHTESGYSSVSTLANDSASGQVWQPLSVGLRGRPVADFIEVVWPDGVYQTELDLKPGLHVLRETQRQLSSCPVLFAWNGTTFEFVSDILGVGGIGNLVAPGQYATPRPRESFQLPPGLPALRGDRFVLSITEPMEEVAMIDHVELEAIDMPPGLELTLDERAATGAPQATGEARYYDKLIAPVAATANGQDVSAEVSTVDRRAVTLPAVDPRYLGLLEKPLELEFRFDQDLSLLSDPMLVFDGWIEYGYAQTVFAAWQSNRTYDSVTLYGRKPGGEWQLLLPSFGYPAGMPRQGSVPIAGMPPGTSELKLVTNQQIYWDRLAVAQGVSASDSVRVHRLPVDQAKVRRIGFPRRTMNDQRAPSFDYDDRLTFWDVRYPAGAYTALGAGLELVEQQDDALAVIGPGDTLEIAFRDNLPALEDGWSRRFVLKTVGWCKDMDLYTEDSGSVGPLPMLGKGSIAQSRLHERYNTRYLSGH